MNICKNCNQEFEGNFCNHCGQSVGTHKMDFHFLWHDIQHGLFHFDNGIFYTLKQLFTRPGHSIREFIEGKRVRHFKPSSLIFILAAVYGLVYYNFHYKLLMETSVSGSQGEDVFKIITWMFNNYALTIFIAIPFYALGTFFAFKKQGYSFVEHLVLNAFLTGQKLFILIATFPFIYFYGGTPAFERVTTIANFIAFILMFWVFAQFFNKLSKIKSFLLTILSQIISMLFVAILVGLILLIAVFIFGVKL